MAPSTADADRKQDGNRNVPALVQRDEKQISEEHSETEHDSRASAGGLFLQGGSGPFEAVSGRQGCARDTFHRRKRLAGAVAGLRRAVHNRGPVSVVTHHRLRPLHELCLGQGADRDHLCLGVAHIDPVDVVHFFAKRGLGLDIDLPCAAEHVEVVDVVAAERRLQGIEDIGDLDAEHLRLVAVDIEIDLRRVGSIGAEHARELGLPVGRHEEAAERCREIGRRLALQRLQHVLEAAGTAEAENGRKVERERDGTLDGRHLRPQAAL